MSFYYGNNKDARTTPAFSGASGRASLVAETFPRYVTVTSSAPTAQNVYLSRIHLLPGSYTTLTVAKGATQGATLADTFVGLYDTSLARVAVSADLSATLAAIAASATGTLTLNYTVTAEADFFVALLVGSAGTMPTLVRAQPPTDAWLSLDPPVTRRHSSAVTALPATVTNATSGNLWFWFRYE